MGKIMVYTNKIKNAMDLFNQVSTLNTQLSALLAQLPAAMESTHDMPFPGMSDDGATEALMEAIKVTNEHKKLCDVCSTTYIKTAVGLKNIYKVLEPIAAMEYLSEMGGKNDDKCDSSNE